MICYIKPWEDITHDLFILDVNNVKTTYSLLEIGNDSVVLSVDKKHIGVANEL